MSAVEEVVRSFLDDPIHDLASRADWRIAKDVVENQVRNRGIEVPEANFGVPNFVCRNIRSGQLDGSRVDVRQDHATAVGESSRDDPEGAVSATQVEDGLARTDLDRIEEQFGSAVESGPGEHAGIRPENERVTMLPDPYLAGSPPGGRPFLEVLLGHRPEESPGPP